MQDVTSRKAKPIEIADPFARRLIGKYLDNRKDDIVKLQRALADSDFETIRVTGHNLYGSGSAYGLDDISWFGASIEEAANASDGPQIERLIREMTDFLHKLRVY